MKLLINLNISFKELRCLFGRCFLKLFFGLKNKNNKENMKNRPGSSFFYFKKYKKY